MTQLMPMPLTVACVRACLLACMRACVCYDKWRTSEGEAEGCNGHVGSAVKVLVAIHYSVLVAKNGYIRNVVV